MCKLCLSNPFTKFQRDVFHIVVVVVVQISIYMSFKKFEISQQSDGKVLRFIQSGLKSWASSYMVLFVTSVINMGDIHQRSKMY
jgi:hypothetical protein